jgi:hypothetical protein
LRERFAAADFAMLPSSDERADSPPKARPRKEARPGLSLG